jgi:peptidoglycan/LPS O-acetylase OafA/YrhL
MTARETGVTPYPAWLEAGRIPCLDGLRAVSIVLVVAEHSFRIDGQSAIARHFVGNIGFIGVSAFFALSGFLITLLLVREQRREGRISLRQFYRRRALRIMPAYATYLAFLLLLAVGGGLTLTARDWTAALTYSMNFVDHPSWEVGHAWSLSVEEQFYLVWPVLVLLLSPARAVPMVVGYLAVAPIVRAVMLVETGSVEVIEQATLLHIDAIAAGSLLALLSTNAALVARFSPAAGTAARGVLIGAGCLLLSYSFEELAPFRMRYFNETLRYSVDAAALATIVWCAPFAASTWLGRVLESRAFTTVGMLSYSLYLWQQPFLNPHGSQWFNAPPVSLLLTVCAAVASYYFVEAPFLRLKNGGYAKPSRAVATAAAGTQPTNA